MTVEHVVAMPVPCYARILPPAVKVQLGNPVLVRWSDVARHNGEVIGQESAWEEISGLDVEDGQPGIWDGAPTSGYFDDVTALTLTSILADMYPEENSVWGGIYEWRLHTSLTAGYLETTEPFGGQTQSHFSDLNVSDRFVCNASFEYQGFQMQLLHGAVRELLQVAVCPRIPANLLWSITNRWCIAAPSDLKSIYIGGSNQLIKSIIASHDIESFEVYGNNAVC
ncbi:Uncharacterised protein [Mycobacteroides abscessus subsp. abscessus]|nr:Uncharacterised protein [Mycobacteroides abscessus subsp. abscessus]